VPLTPTDHYAYVANELCEEFDDYPEWMSCQDGRWRSAISRAYYSVFLALKERLIAARPTEFPKRFPRVDVHSKVRKAVGAVLGTAPGSLATALRELAERRTDADYEWWSLPVRELDVMRHLSRAKRVRARIAALSEVQVGSIAFELMHIEREEQAKQLGTRGSAQPGTNIAEN